MADTRKITLKSGTYTISKIPGGDAIDIAFRLMELDGVTLASAGAARSDLQALGMAQAGLARSMRDPDFRANVWDKLLAGVTHDQTFAPICGPGWEVRLRGDDVTDLLEAYHAAAKFNCDRFGTVFAGQSDVIQALKPATKTASLPDGQAQDT